jgi:pantoate--beta-alanine ligase
MRSKSVFPCNVINDSWAYNGVSFLNSSEVDFLKVISDPNQFQALALKWRKGKKSVGFVPTMGALHEGHLQLVRQCHKENPITVVSIYVNPLQFGPKEDYSKYPRTLQADLDLLKSVKTTAVFTPSDDVFYPEGFSTRLKVEGPLVKGLCAPFRPGHFDGVATVVAKLLGVVMPDKLYLGQKDFQQVAVLRQMVKDLHLPVEVVSCPTVREKDGLAMSSRNTRLSPDGRRAAVVLSKALRVGKSMFDLGTRNSKELLTRVRAVIADEKRVKLQYLEAVHPDNLSPVVMAEAGTVLILAAFVDDVRLIDNLQL